MSADNAASSAMKYKAGDTVTFGRLVEDALAFLHRACGDALVDDVDLVQRNAETIARHTAKVLRLQGIAVTVEP